MNQRLRLRRAPHTAIAIPLLLGVASCATGMSGPMDDNNSADDSGATYETGSAPETGGGEDSSSTQHPGADSSTPYGGDDGSTGGQDSSMTDPDVQVDTGGPLPQDSSSGQQDSSSGGEDAGPPETSAPSNCAGPSTPAACHACTPSASCQLQPNGCYNGYVCNTQTNHCGAPGTCS